MRLGGAIMKPWHTAAEWIGLVKELGYSTVVFPVDCGASKALIRELKQRIDDEGWIIGEVGVWRNLMAEDPALREQTVQYSIGQLALAEEIGANCCVNISGSRGTVWDGYHPANYSTETFELVVEQSRRIIDAVKPEHTVYSLEPMPWMVPDGPDSYLKLIRAIDRKAFGVHMDFTNMINSLDRYLHSAELIEECFEKLGSMIRSVHIKDCLLVDTILPFSVQEVPVGKGSIDLKLVLQLVEGLDEDTTAYTEHLDSHEMYVYSTKYLRELSAACGVKIK